MIAFIDKSKNYYCPFSKVKMTWLLLSACSRIFPSDGSELAPTDLPRADECYFFSTASFPSLRHIPSLLLPFRVRVIALAWTLSSIDLVPCPQLLSFLPAILVLLCPTGLVLVFANQHPGPQLRSDSTCFLEIPNAPMYHWQILLPLKYNIYDRN
jgi:hypothetical protein